MSTCRTCGAPIRWVSTERGKKMPIDPEPYEGDDPRGLFVLRQWGPDEPTAIAVPGPSTFAGEPVYRSHFATCPQAAQHRRRPA